MSFSFIIANIGSGGGGFNLALLFGMIIFLGTFSSRLFQKLGIPQVVGCIVVGIFLGDLTGLIDADTIKSLKPFTMFALGIIGFMIGGELRGDVFKKYGRQFFVILFSQGIGAFVLVAVAVSAAGWFITKDAFSSIAVGLVLGAIASATAPAATVNVLWEYKTRGPLTAAILAIVALDDGLALLLYRAAATSAQALIGTATESVWATTGLLLGEIIGSILLGFLLGVLLYYLLKFVRADDKMLAFSIASLLLVVGISIVFGIDPILPAMTLGITIANLSPRQSKGLFELVRKFTPPIYISFFVLAGPHMELCMAGICLLPQAGIAIGLAILASEQFDAKIGKSIIMIVMMATFVMEIIGPMLVKVGVKRAGEVGLNVTEEDLIKSYTVGDVMESEPVTIAYDMSLQNILEVFGTTDFVYYPVVDPDQLITGVITIARIKEMFANQDVAGWLLACDVTEPVLDKTNSSEPLEDALELMRKYDLEQMPVVADEGGDRLVGILDYRRTNRKISAEVLRRREKADTAQGGL